LKRARPSKRRKSLSGLDEMLMKRADRTYSGARK
jgi:hypothetical protein